MPVSKSNKTSLTPYWSSPCERAIVYLGDCREVLAKLDPEQFHAVVTDPPYGLEFMGLDFDAPWKHQLDKTGKIEECDEGTDKSHPFRDGTQRVCYGNNRTRRQQVDAKDRRADEMDDPVKAKYLQHNVEYVRDSHLYQEWFQECAEAILRVARPGAHLLSFGGTRMWHRMAVAIEDSGWDYRETIMWCYSQGFPKSHDISKAIDKMYGVERPAMGPPIAGLGNGQFTKANGVDHGYGYGAEYVNTSPVTEDAKRWDGWGSALKPALEPIIAARRPLDGSLAQNTIEHGCGGLNIDGCRVSSGQWPANLITDGSEEVQSVLSKATRFFACFPRVEVATLNITLKNMAVGGQDSVKSRMYYTAKADHTDRPHGKDSTTHPTVKPQDLMQYLVRLVCPRGGTTLDPFMGSGSTGVAAIIEGMNFVGVEQSKEYADIAVGRLKLALESAPPAVELRTRQSTTSNKAAPPPPRPFRLD